MLTFYSNALSKQVAFDDLRVASTEELQELHKELSEAVSALNGVLTEAKARERASGVPLDPNWLHRVNTKKRIVLKFAAEANSRMHGGSAATQRAAYERIYREQFRATLLEEFDDNELRELEREVLDKSRAAYNAWLTSTKQQCWFVP